MFLDQDIKNKIVFKTVRTDFWFSICGALKCTFYFLSWQCLSKNTAARRVPGGRLKNWGWKTISSKYSFRCTGIASNFFCTCFRPSKFIPCDFSSYSQFYWMIKRKVVVDRFVMLFDRKTNSDELQFVLMQNVTHNWRKIAIS